MNTDPHSCVFSFVCVCVCVLLLLIVMLAVQQAVPAVAGPGERAQTHGALHARFVPGALVHAQQKSVGDGRLAARTQLPPSSVLGTCKGRISACTEERSRSEAKPSSGPPHATIATWTNVYGRSGLMILNSERL